MDLCDSITEGLNDEQYRAVMAPPDRHYLVLAGAGCGKTTVLTRRIAYLAHGGVPLSRILALTFTRKAADEMADRVARLTKKSSPPGLPTITTFHAFALQVLGAEIEGKVNFNRIGFSGAPQCCDERQRLALLARCCTGDERASLGADLPKLDAMLERLNLFPESIGDIPSQAGLLNKISERFKRQKRAEALWDFSDLIDGAVTLFEHAPSVMAWYQCRYAAVLVDEFQDTNPLQLRLLNQMLHTGKYLYAVGDDDQAIYGFRGADIRPTLAFTTHFPGAEIIKLQTNYRSVPAILSKANRIFREKDPAYRKILVSGRYPPKSGVAPSIHRFANQETMGDWMIAQAATCSETLKVPVNEMAALFRVNQTAEWLERYFLKKGLSEDRRLQLLTVHKSKGLEFPVVFLSDMEESVFPSYREPAKRRIRSMSELLKYCLVRHKPIECDWEEERRLFYVAITRAQQRLFLLFVRNKQIYGRKRRFEQSRFLRFIR